LFADAEDPAELLPTDVLVFGGEALPPSLRERIRDIAPRLRVFNHYGPTETAVGASCLAIDEPTDPRCASVPVGFGLGDTVLTVVDRAGNAVPPWCPGEVVISGPSVDLGYLAELAGGRQGFGAAGTYRSGDVGRVVPGVGVEIRGRVDDQIKLRGYRIQLGEVEGLLREHADVLDAALVARADDNGLVTHLDAYVVRRAGGTVTPTQLRDLLSRRLPPVAVPTGWRLLSRMPLTANGKVDRAALPGMAAHAGTGRPRDWIEQHLLVLWAQVLELDGLSPEDDFFEQGGHSLRAIKLVSRVNRAFGTKLPMSTIFRARSVAAMARLLREDGNTGTNLVPLRPAAGRAPVFCLHPGSGTTLSYWELAQLLPAGHAVTGVDSVGLHGMAPCGDFAKMAEHYATAIAATAAEAPVLVGWDVGGLLALETARALRRAGREVARLIVLDCPAPGYDDEAPRLDEYTPIRRFASHYQLDLPDDLPPAPAQYDVVLAAMRAGGHLPPTAGVDELRTLLDVHTANMTALDRHVDSDGFDASTPDFPVTLVRAEPSDATTARDRTWGWSALVGPTLCLISVDADHHGVLAAPAVSTLADLLGGHLTEAHDA
jgi:thioesterase domain-containing protein/acyl carrier protein